MGVTKRLWLCGGLGRGLRKAVLTWRGIEFPDRSWGRFLRRSPDPEISRHIGQLILRKVDDEKLGNGGKQRPEPDLPDCVEFETRHAVRFRIGAPNPRYQRCLFTANLSFPARSDRCLPADARLPELRA